MKLDEYNFKPKLPKISAGDTRNQNPVVAKYNRQTENFTLLKVHCGTTRQRLNQRVSHDEAKTTQQEGTKGFPADSV